MRRVVVTGMGLVSPLGIGLENVWGRLLAGESGIRAIQSFDVADLPSRVAAQDSSVPWPRGVIRPIPVTTTRRLDKGAVLKGRPPRPRRNPDPAVRKP